MEWIEYKVLTDPAYGEEVAELFHRMESGGVVLEEEAQLQPGSSCLWIKAYFPVGDDHQEEVLVNLQALERDFGITSRLFTNNMRNEDWENSWKEFFHGFRVGKRIVIRPSWEEVVSNEDDVVVCIDPDKAFGTGQHTTTRFCLELLEWELIPNSRVLDAGCGSGILSIAAALLGAGKVFGIDNDEMAVEIARENIAINDVEGQVGIVWGDLEGLEATAEVDFDLIVANLTDGLFMDLDEVLYNALMDGGKLIASGIQRERWIPLRDKLLAAGFTLKTTMEEGEWLAAVLER